MLWGGRGGRGFGRGFARGLGFGPGLGFGLGYGPNPYWSCRFFPWLPRGWWRFPYSYGYSTPYGYGTPYGYSAPYQSTAGFPFFPQFSPMWSYGTSPLVQSGTMPPTQEREMLEQNLKLLEEQLGEIQRRLSELESQE